MEIWENMVWRLGLGDMVIEIRLNGDGNEVGDYIRMYRELKGMRLE